MDSVPNQLVPNRSVPITVVADTADGAGRFAPSPTGELHLGNLRTALVAWLSARSQDLRFVVRIEDLDRVTSSVEHEAAQLMDLAELGLDWDGDVVRQSERFALYDAAIEQLTAQGRTYECYCSRREIHDAPRAPNGEMMPDGAYPGTCRLLTDSQRQVQLGLGRRPSTRLRADDEILVVIDDLAGRVSGLVDDFVLRRRDGVPAYNLAVVVDDDLQGVAEVVRGSDLLTSTPRQVLLQRLLRLRTPRYRHVPMVLGADGVRLAKRHGAVTLRHLAAVGVGTAEVLSMLASSLGIIPGGGLGDGRITLAELLARFDPSVLITEPWVLPVQLQRSAS